MVLIYLVLNKRRFPRFSFVWKLSWKRRKVLKILSALCNSTWKWHAVYNIQSKIVGPYSWKGRKIWGNFAVIKWRWRWRQSIGTGINLVWNFYVQNWDISGHIESAGRRISVKSSLNPAATGHQSFSILLHLSTLSAWP